jgi:hypothetical protein
MGDGAAALQIAAPLASRASQHAPCFLPCPPTPPARPSYSFPPSPPPAAVPILTVVVPVLTTDNLTWQCSSEAPARQCLSSRGLVPILAEGSARCAGYWHSACN